MDENRGYSIMFCPNGDSRDVLRRGENSDVLHRLRNITPYDSAYDLIGTECDAQYIDLLSDDFCNFLRHANEWDAIMYYCLNGDTVIICDSINGDVLAYCDVSALLEDMKEEYESTTGKSAINANPI